MSPRTQFRGDASLATPSHYRITSMLTKRLRSKFAAVNGGAGGAVTKGARTDVAEKAAPTWHHPTDAVPAQRAEGLDAIKDQDDVKSAEGMVGTRSVAPASADDHRLQEM